MVASAKEGFKSEHLTYWHQPEKNVVINKCVGVLQMEEMKAGLMYALSLVKNGASGWLSDVSEMAVMGPEESDWLNDVFVPMAVEAGLLRLANVVPKDVFAELAMDSWNESVSAASNELQVRNFDSVDAAYSWIIS